MAGSPASSDPDLCGTLLAHFRVVAKLGAGGMGVVYRAEDVQLRRPVALKVLSATVAQDAELRARFLREARALAAASHPNIATVFEVDEAEGTAYLAMELVEGESLRSVLSRGPLPIPRAVSIAREVARGLERAHRAGVVHRDLKPENVMLAAEGAVKLVDFGLAKHDGSPVEDPGAGQTLSGQILGTPGYMAPEQALGRAVDPRTDLFSLGVVLFEMLTGGRPFGGTTAMEQMMAVAHDVPQPLRLHVPADLDRLLDACLQKSPEARPGSAAEVVARLDALAGDLSAMGTGPHPAPLAATIVSAPSLGAADGEEDTAISAVTVNERLRKRRGRARRVLAGALVIAAAAIGAWIWRAPSFPTPLTKLPLPHGNRAAVGAYAAAIQALHDADWLAARGDLEKAVQADPEMALAHLRLALVEFALPNGVAAARAQLEAAQQRRSQLSSRDALLLGAIEPLIQRDPPDYAEAAQRLTRATRARPGDAELQFLLAYVLQGRDGSGALAAARRASQLDPAYADALQLQSAALAALGQTEEALAPLDRCIANVAVASDCLLERIDLHTWNGECAAAEQDARSLNAVQPSPTGLLAWAESLLAQGKPVGAAQALLSQAETKVPPAQASFARARHAIALAALQGDFDSAIRLARDEQARVHGQLDYWTQGALAEFLVDALVESGRTNEAADAAQAFLARNDALTHSHDQYDLELTPMLLRVLRDAGRLPEADYRAQLAQFASAPLGKLGVSASGRWLALSAATATTAEAAKAALAAAPELPRYREYGLDFTDQARVRRIAGDVDGALPMLRRAAASCRLLEDPFRWVRAQAELGAALEVRGDVAGACASYRRVLPWWGQAKPRSVTAELAQTRIRELHCP